MTDRAASINSGSNTNAVMSCKLLDLLFSEKKNKNRSLLFKKDALAIFDAKVQPGILITSCLAISIRIVVCYSMFAAAGKL